MCHGSLCFGRRRRLRKVSGTRERGERPGACDYAARFKALRLARKVVCHGVVLRILPKGQVGW